jgi:LacI family transcriptional regulator
MKRKATLKDIAKVAGVTPMTVSRVMNDAAYVSTSVREKVLKAAQELRYQPNLLARSLKARETKTIGVLLADMANPFTALLAHGIRKVLDARGYTAFICLSENSGQQEQASLRALYEHQVDGVIVATRATSLGNQTLLSLAEEHLPIVQIGDRGLNHPYVDTVTANHWQGGYEATEHLIQLGHRAIGFVGVTLVHGSGLRRFQGYLDALRQHRLTPREEWMAGPRHDGVPGYSTQMVGYDGIKQLLKARKRPTAVFARNDMTALGVMLGARECGLRIPQDLAVVGFDDVPLAAMASPPLTTVFQPIQEQGEQAATLLLDRLQAVTPRASETIILPCKLVVRESTMGIQPRLPKRKKVL